MEIFFSLLRFFGGLKLELLGDSLEYHRLGMMRHNLPGRGEGAFLLVELETEVADSRYEFVCSSSITTPTELIGNPEVKREGQCVLPLFFE